MLLRFRSLLLKKSRGRIRPVNFWRTATPSDVSFFLFAGRKMNMRFLPATASTKVLRGMDAIAQYLTGEFDIAGIQFQNWMLLVAAVIFIWIVAMTLREAG